MPGAWGHWWPLAVLSAAANGGMGFLYSPFVFLYKGTAIIGGWRGPATLSDIGARVAAAKIFAAISSGLAACDAVIRHKYHRVWRHVMPLSGKRDYRSVGSTMKIFSGNSNISLTKAICASLGGEMGKASVRRFPDMEVFVEILENVRGEDTFFIQSISYPANDHLMELLVAIDALRRGSARRITAIMPYYGYARQDRKSGPRTPISAKLVANLVTVAGANRCLTLDLHAGQIQGFFDIPLDNLYAEPVLTKDIERRYGKDNIVIVSPDVGGVVRARALARRLGVDLAIIDKRREKASVSEVMNIIGDVRGHRCILIDDIVDSAGTLCNAARALMEAGAKAVCGYVTHGVFSGDATDKIVRSPMERLVITDSIMATEAVRQCGNIEQLSIAPLLGEAIRCIHAETSVSKLFD